MLEMHPLLHLLESCIFFLVACAGVYLIAGGVEKLMTTHVEPEFTSDERHPITLRVRLRGIINIVSGIVLYYLVYLYIFLIYPPR